MAQAPHPDPVPRAPDGGRVVADLITPVKTWLRGLSKDELIAMLESSPDPGRCTGVFHTVTLEGYEYRYPQGWVVQEHERRMEEPAYFTEARSVMAEFSQYFEKCIKPEHRRKKS